MTRTFFFLCMSCFGLVPFAQAQIEVTLRITPTRAVLHESVIAQVRIQNNTAEVVVLDDTLPGQRLWMDIERGPGRWVRQLSPELLGERVEIPPRSAVQRRVNITRTYDLRTTAPYTVSARLDWKGRAYTSNRVFLEVVPGLEMTRMAGAGAGDGTDGRVYRLLTLNRDRGDNLFLRIDDEAQGVCYAVIHLGRLIRMEPPLLRVDAYGHVVVLHQAGPGRYFYHVFTPNGRKVDQKVYTSEQAGVGLAATDDGRFVVTGAVSSLDPED